MKTEQLFSVVEKGFNLFEGHECGHNHATIDTAKRCQQKLEAADRIEKWTGSRILSYYAEK